MADQYNVGDHLITTGQEIAEVIGQTATTGVYITVEGNIRWEYYADQNVPDRLKPALQKYEEIAQIARRTFREGHRHDARRELANALRAALEAADGDSPLKALELVERSFSHQYINQAATRYACGSLIAVTILFGLSWLLYVFGSEVIRPLTMGAMGGAAGSLISVIIRIRHINANASPLWYWLVEGLFRALLGVVFGVFIIILIKANLVLGLAGQNSYASFTISTIAGFSERLVPNILRNLEEKQFGKLRRKRATARPIP